jgi:hypothetical protein
MGFSRDFYIFLLLVWEECDDDDDSVKLNRFFKGFLNISLLWVGDECDDDIVQMKRFARELSTIIISCKVWQGCNGDSVRMNGFSMDSSVFKGFLGFLSCECEKDVMTTKMMMKEWQGLQGIFFFLVGVNRKDLYWTKHFPFELHEALGSWYKESLEALSSGTTT